jgi:HAMP domain-containing protein
MEHGKQSQGGYERSDALLKPIVLFTLVLTLLVAASFAAMRWLFTALDERERAADSAPHPMAQPVEPPAPRLQRETSADLIAHQQRELQLTTRYEWVDRSTGVVRIPVERAIELTLERGLPTRETRK